ncbi:MAG: DinB family protein [Actinomycetota bacterium]
MQARPPARPGARATGRWRGAPDRRGHPGRAGRHAGRVPPSWWETAPGGGWSPLAVVEHLLDVEDIAFVTRIRRIVEEDDPFIVSIDPSARLETSADPGRTVAELVDELARRRAGDAAWVRSLPPLRLDRTGTHDSAGTISARQLVHYWGTHDLVHLSQLLAALRANLEPHIGGMHVFLEEP